jgi:hypothetical protein
MLSFLNIANLRLKNAKSACSYVSSMPWHPEPCLWQCTGLLFLGDPVGAEASTWHVYRMSGAFTVCASRCISCIDLLCFFMNQALAMRESHVCYSRFVGAELFVSSLDFISELYWFET